MRCAWLTTGADCVRLSKPASIVLDIGTGTGILALLAIKFGAEGVYAVEPDPAIEMAREIAAASDCAKKIVFLQETSTGVSLPERVDVIV